MVGSNAGMAIYEIVLVSDAQAKLAGIAGQAAATDTSLRGIGKKPSTTTPQLRSMTNLGKGFEMLTLLTNKNTRATGLNILKHDSLARAARSASLSLGLVSVRIKEGVLPVLGLFSTALVPIIAGLLALAAAAVTAFIALAAILGLGLYKWHSQWKKTLGGGYAGARRPYSSGEDEKNMFDFFGEVFTNLKAVLDEKEFVGAFGRIVSWTKEVFTKTLPNAFREFLRAVDPNAVKIIMNMFTETFPKLLHYIGRFGSEIMLSLGEEGLERINKVIIHMGRELLKAGEWLAHEGGFEALDNLFKGMVEIFRDLNESGKVALPIITKFIKALYYNLIKPILTLFTMVLNTLGVDLTVKLFGLVVTFLVVTKVLTTLTWVAVALGEALLFISSIIGAASASGLLHVILVLGVTLIGTVAIIIVAVAALVYLTLYSSKAAWVLGNLGAAIRNFVTKIKNLITGKDDPLIEYQSEQYFKDKIAERQGVGVESGAMAYMGKTTVPSNRLKLNLNIDEGIILDTVESSMSDIDLTVFDTESNALTYRPTIIPGG